MSPRRLFPLAAIAILVFSASAGAVISSQTSGPQTRHNADAQLTSRACGPATFKGLVGHKLRYAESLARAVGISTVPKARLPSNAPAGIVIGYNLAQGGDSSYCSSIVGLWVEVSSGPQRDMRQILRYATMAPSHSECATPITIRGDGNFGPATCGTQHVNVDAWDYYISNGAVTWNLALVPHTSQREVTHDLCVKGSETGPIGEAVLAMANAYYGWGFTQAWMNRATILPCGT
jgi:hypothetical protein